LETRVLATEEEFEQCARLIRDAFATVAAEFNYTKENASTFPAFITAEKLISESARGVRFFGMFDGADQVGSVALEKAPELENVFFLERLAVHPAARHRGLGVKLMDFAFDLIKKRGGEKVKIAIVDENRQLKNWYIAYGFEETGTKTYPHLPFTVCLLEKKINRE
jgi:ribosomal protein S18 acetylase RimI-like enzyme